MSRLEMNAEPSMEEILARFPDRVSMQGGPAVDLQEWATGESVRTLVREGWKAQSNAAYLASPFAKSGGGGLDPAHGPF